MLVTVNENHRDIWERLKTADRPVILYGTGNGADKILDELERIGVKVQDVMVSDDFARGQVFRDFRVKNLFTLEQIYQDPVILIAFGSQRPEVMENIFSLAEKHTVLCADVPVYGDNIFNTAFYVQYAAEIQKAYDCFEDSFSRKTFENIIRFRLSGELSCLQEVYADKEKVFREILCLGTQESYLDLGAYRGDTIDEFLHFTGGKYREIVALEPDNKTYGKLIQHTARMQNTRCFCMGIWSENTDLCFDGSLGRGSSVRKDGKSAVPVTTIDTLFRKRPLTYLKIDAEGAEAEALAGGETVIRRDKPRMNMALYHRSEDIFRLPLMLKSIRPDYRLYIRQHPHIPAWDLNLYAI